MYKKYIKEYIKCRTFKVPKQIVNHLFYNLKIETVNSGGVFLAAYTRGIIKIDNEQWKTLNEIAKKNLIFHELDHHKCSLRI